jgi:hypothetical protein
MVSRLQEVIEEISSIDIVITELNFIFISTPPYFCDGGVIV